MAPVPSDDDPIEEVKEVEPLQDQQPTTPQEELLCEPVEKDDSEFLDLQRQ